MKQKNERILKGNMKEPEKQAKATGQGSQVSSSRPGQPASQPSQPRSLAKTANIIMQASRKDEREIKGN